MLLVGAYNGGQIVTLADALSEDGPADDAVLEAEQVLRTSPVLSRLVEFRVRPTQLTLRPRRPLPRGLLCRIVLEAFSTVPRTAERLSTHESGHALDVIPVAISKIRVVEEILL